MAQNSIGPRLVVPALATEPCEPPPSVSLETDAALGRFVHMLDQDVLGPLTIPLRYDVLRLIRKHVNHRMECIANAAISHADAEALQIAMRSMR